VNINILHKFTIVSLFYPKYAKYCWIYHNEFCVKCVTTVSGCPLAACVVERISSGEIFQFMLAISASS
jgi:hypothetical protein